MSEPLRLVLDTNVLVSALLNPGRGPARLLALLWAHNARVLHDARLVGEYRAVLARPKFRALDAALTEALLRTLLAHGEEVGPAPAWPEAMADPDDRMFIEVALAGRAHALVTGNGRHYPRGAGFEVLSPAALLGRLEGAAEPEALDARARIG